MKSRRQYAYSTHMGILARAILATQGPILELGIGMFSTPLIHHLAIDRDIVSYDHDPGYVEWGQQFAGPRHRLLLAADWASAPLERPWDVAFVDHAPGERRRYEIARLAPYARFIVVHDTCERDERVYHLRDVFQTFPSQYSTTIRPRTTILSRTEDVSVVCHGNA